jgi:hypothetical protein
MRGQGPCHEETRQSSIASMRPRARRSQAWRAPVSASGRSPTCRPRR